MLVYKCPGKKERGPYTFHFNPFWTHICFDPNRFSVVSKGTQKPGMAATKSSQPHISNNALANAKTATMAANLI